MNVRLGFGVALLLAASLSLVVAGVYTHYALCRVVDAHGSEAGSAEPGRRAFHAHTRQAFYAHTYDERDPSAILRASLA